MVEAIKNAEVRWRVVAGVSGGEAGGAKGRCGIGAMVGLGELFGGGSDIGNGNIVAVRRAGDWLQGAARGDRDVGARRFGWRGRL